MPAATIKPIAALSPRQPFAENKTRALLAGSSIRQPVASLSPYVRTDILEYFSQDFTTNNHDYVYSVLVQ